VNENILIFKKIVLLINKIRFLFAVAIRIITDIQFVLKSVFKYDIKFKFLGS
jgi:hypothetical protein